MHLTDIRDIKTRLFLILAIAALPLQGYCNRNYLDTLKTRIASIGTTKAGSLHTAGTDSITAIGTDTLLHVHSDSLHTDTLAHAHDTAINKSTLEAPIFSGGKDSIVKDFNVDGRKMIYYYGDVNVKYNDIDVTLEGCEREFGSIVFSIEDNEYEYILQEEKSKTPWRNIILQTLTIIGMVAAATAVWFVSYYGGKVLFELIYN